MWTSMKSGSRMCRRAFPAGFRMSRRTRPTSMCARDSGFSPFTARTWSAASRSICWPGRIKSAFSQDAHGMAAQESGWLLQAAEERLRQFGVPQQAIADLEQSRQGAARHRCRIARFRLHHRAQCLAQRLCSTGDKALHHCRSFHGVGLCQCVSERCWHA